MFPQSIAFSVDASCGEIISITIYAIYEAKPANMLNCFVPGSIIRVPAINERCIAYMLGSLTPSGTCIMIISIHVSGVAHLLDIV
jgi:hypothetical protein